MGYAFSLSLENLTKYIQAGNNTVHTGVMVSLKHEKLPWYSYSESNTILGFIISHNYVTEIL